MFCFHHLLICVFALSLCAPMACLAQEHSNITPSTSDVELKPAQKVPLLAGSLQPVLVVKRKAPDPWGLDQVSHEDIATYIPGLRYSVPVGYGTRFSVNWLSSIPNPELPAWQSGTFNTVESELYSKFDTGFVKLFQTRRYETLEDTLHRRIEAAQFEQRGLRTGWEHGLLSTRFAFRTTEQRVPGQERDTLELDQSFTLKASEKFRPFAAYRFQQVNLPDGPAGMTSNLPDATFQSTALGAHYTPWKSLAYTGSLEALDVLPDGRIPLLASRQASQYDRLRWQNNLEWKAADQMKVGGAWYRDLGGSEWTGPQTETGHRAWVQQNWGADWQTTLDAAQRVRASADGTERFNRAAGVTGTYKVRERAYFSTRLERTEEEVRGARQPSAHEPDAKNSLRLEMRLRW